MRIRHEGLRALHERADAARLLAVSFHGFGVSCSGCIPCRATVRASGVFASPATGAWCFRFEDGEAVDVDLIDYH